jgi:hypothetical protein
MKVLSKLQVWNPDYAFAYPSLAVNARGDVGIVLAWGGKNDKRQRCRRYPWGLRRLVPERERYDDGKMG